MKTIHLFEDAYYLISNRSVAISNLFFDYKDVESFKLRIGKNLSSLCDIIAFGFQSEEFQLVVKMKSRDDIEHYFKERYSNYFQKYGKVPKTTYIFAQAMANLQSGYVKKFNFRHGRDGGLMAGRYKRKLIESEMELDLLIESVNKLTKLSHRAARWAVKDNLKKGKCGFRKYSEWSSSNFYEKMNLKSKYSWFVMKDNIYVRGHFDELPPKEILWSTEKEKISNFSYFIFF